MPQLSRYLVLSHMSQQNAILDHNYAIR